MPKIDKKILRVIDANYNRAKEGLRVVEDIFRFITQSDKLRKDIRAMRHALKDIFSRQTINKAILERDSITDPGKPTDALELSRKNYQDVLYANLQRVKESLRVLEEFAKIISPKDVAAIKDLRYKAYTVEKAIIKKL